MPEKSHLELSREELYQLVWTKPMRSLAKEYRISDRALAKFCARQQVPVPPRGYWARKSAGHPVSQKELPAFVVKRKAPPEPIRQAEKASKPARAAAPSSCFTTEKKVKTKLREHRRNLGAGIRYEARILEWNFTYSFGLNPNYDPYCKHTLAWVLGRRDLYQEWRWLTLKGKLDEPPDLMGHPIEVDFNLRDFLNRAERDKHLNFHESELPSAIGSLQKGNGRVHCTLSIPDDAQNTILQVAAADKVNFISIYGSKMRYGSGLAYSFYLHDVREEE